MTCREIPARRTAPITRLAIGTAALILACLAGPVAAGEQAGPAPAGHALDIRPDPKAKWQANLEDVRRVLTSAAGALWTHFPDRQLPPILVEPRGGPITLFARGPAGEYRVRLNTGENYWSQYSYQFAHEFCHILCGNVEDEPSNKWFEESLCEMASIFAIRCMAETWKTDPPYPNWLGYASSLKEYSDDLIQKAAKPPGGNLAAWYKENEAQLRKEPCQREKNRVVAVVLLPLFEKQPEHWEAVSWLNAAPSPTPHSFTEYLTSWQSRAPAKHRPFIGQVAAKFGIALPEAPKAEAAVLLGAPGPGSKGAEPDPKETSVQIGEKVSMRLALIPAGKFTVGSLDGEKDRHSVEGPQRRVTISHPFYMSVYEVTQEQYEQVMGTNPSEFKGAQNPVECVSWGDAVEFCRRLSQKTGKTIRLPTEAEWEYACRAGSKTRFSYGDDDEKLGDYAWYHINSENKTHPVGQKKPNAWGLYDMHGNVLEWCADWFAHSYVNAKNQDPQGPDSGTVRVLRGGYWDYYAMDCRSAYRGRIAPGYRHHSIGFRVSVDLK